LEFAEKLLQAIKLNADSSLDVCHLPQSVTNKHCEELVVMTTSLRELQQLKKNYKISVALAEFMKNDKREVVNILLGKVAPTNIKPLMTHFLKKLMLDNGLVPDTIMSYYILDIHSHSAAWW
jgi:hypothetical protein